MSAIVPGSRHPETTLAVYSAGFCRKPALPTVNETPAPITHGQRLNDDALRPTEKIAVKFRLSRNLPMIAGRKMEIHVVREASGRCPE